MVINQMIVCPWWGGDRQNYVRPPPSAHAYAHAQAYAHAHDGHNQVYRFFHWNCNMFNIMNSNLSHASSTTGRNNRLENVNLNRCYVMCHMLSQMICNMMVGVFDILLISITMYLWFF